MKKFVLPVALVVLITLGFAIANGWFNFNGSKEPTKIEESYIPPMPAQPAASTNNLPAVMPLIKLDGTEVMANTLLDKTVLVVFLPDCDHCQREAEQIQKHLSAFKDYSLYFISSANVLEIKQFAEKYKLAGYDNVFMTHTEQVYITNSFGYIPTPSLYIYSAGHLIKDFKGETPIDSILPALGSK